MSSPRFTGSAARGAAAALATLLVACGPYAQVGQRLDAGLTLANTEAWIMPSGTRIRLLLLGKAADGTSETYAFSDLDASTGAGGAGGIGHPNYTVQGTWSEGGGKLTLRPTVRYELPDERHLDLKERHGAGRPDDPGPVVQVVATRTPTRLTLGGDPALAGTYVPVSEALAHLGAATPTDAVCAFYVANLGVMTTQVRILYFGSANMVQYTSAQRFQGTLTGGVVVYMAGVGGDVTISFQQASDIPGLTLDGVQRTNSDLGGNGRTRDSVGFTIQPDPTGPPTVKGSIGYDLQITSGTATGGTYTITLDDGVTGVTDPVSAPAPSVASCLGLSP